MAITDRIDRAVMMDDMTIFVTPAGLRRGVTDRVIREHEEVVEWLFAPFPEEASAWGGIRVEAAVPIARGRSLPAWVRYAGGEIGLSRNLGRAGSIATLRNNGRLLVLPGMLNPDWGGDRVHPKLTRLLTTIESAAIERGVDEIRYSVPGKCYHIGGVAAWDQAVNPDGADYLWLTRHVLDEWALNRRIALRPILEEERRQAREAKRLARFEASLRSKSAIYAAEGDPIAGF